MSEEYTVCRCGARFTNDAEGERAYLEGEPSPVQLLIETARNLEAAGTGFILMPRNSVPSSIQLTACRPGVLGSR